MGAGFEEGPNSKTFFSSFFFCSLQMFVAKAAASSGEPELQDLLF